MKMFSHEIFIYFYTNDSCSLTFNGLTLAADSLFPLVTTSSPVEKNIQVLRLKT